MPTSPPSSLAALCMMCCTLVTWNDLWSHFPIRCCCRPCSYWFFCLCCPYRFFSAFIMPTLCSQFRSADISFRKPPLFFPFSPPKRISCPFLLLLCHSTHIILHVFLSRHLPHNHEYFGVSDLLNYKLFERRGHLSSFLTHYCHQVSAQCLLLWTEHDRDSKHASSFLIPSPVLSPILCCI